MSCRDGNNENVDPSICLSKLYEEYRRLELYQDCHVSCNDVSCQYATALDAGLCSRNCIGTRRKRNHPIGKLFIPIHFINISMLLQSYCIDIHLKSNGMLEQAEPRRKAAAWPTTAKKSARARGSHSRTKIGPPASCRIISGRAVPVSNTGAGNVSLPPMASWLPFRKNFVPSYAELFSV